MYDKHYLRDPQEVELLPGAVEGLTLLQAAGCALVVLSNQSGVGRGYFDTACVDAVNARLDALLRQQGVRLTGILYCPHAPETQCLCRKPAPGLAHEAARRWHLESLLRAGRCVSVGDKMSDVLLGQGLGGRGVLVLTGKGAAEAQKLEQAHARDEARAAMPAPDYMGRDLCEAALWIEKSFHK